MDLDSDADFDTLDEFGKDAGLSGIAELPCASVLFLDVGVFFFLPTQLPSTAMILVFKRKLGRRVMLFQSSAESYVRCGRRIVKNDWASSLSVQ